MNRHKSLLLSILIIFLFVGCGAPEITPTPIPRIDTPAPTPIPPTDSPKLIPEPIDPIEVTFDGKDCGVKGLPILPAGEYTFNFIDLSEMNGELWLVNLNVGKTTQDLLDGQSEPGDWYPKPAWAHYDSQVSIESEQIEGKRVDTSTWKLDKVGEHTILCYVASPQMLWMPGYIMIVE